jgi:hypothetical protein
MVSLALIVQPAHGAWCFGTVNYLSLDNTGSVTIVPSWRTAGFGYVKACNLNQDWNGVTPTTCTGWFSMLKMAQQTRSYVWWFYPDSVVPTLNGAECSNMTLEPNSPVPVKIVPCSTSPAGSAC